MNIRNDVKLVSSTVIAFVLMAILVYTSSVFSDTKKVFAEHVLIIAMGVSLGWVSGTFSSPYNERESNRFGAMAKAVGAFISGYILGKMDKLAEHIFNPGTIFEVHNGRKIVIFIIASIIGFLVTFVYRNYAPNTRLPNNPTDSN